MTLHATIAVGASDLVGLESKSFDLFKMHMEEQQVSHAHENQ